MIRKQLNRFFFGDEATADPLQYGLILALVSTSAVAAIAALAVS
jgi:Flp pilus assembly pilin Flp